MTSKSGAFPVRWRLAFSVSCVLVVAAAVFYRGAFAALSTLLSLGFLYLVWRLVRAIEARADAQQRLAGEDE